MILLSFRHLSSEKDDLTIKPKQVLKAFLNWGCQELSTTCCEKKLLMWICIMCFAFNLRIIPESRSVLRNKVQKVQLSCGSFILLKERTENKHHILSVPCLWRVQNCRCATLGLHTHSATLSPVTHSPTHSEKPPVYQAQLMANALCIWLWLHFYTIHSVDFKLHTFGYVNTIMISLCHDVWVHSIETTGCVIWSSCAVRYDT